MLTKNIFFIILIIVIGLLLSCGKPAPVPDPQSIQLNLTIDPNSWASIPSGEFISELNEIKKTIEYDYQIMITEVTYEQFCRYLNEALAKSLISHKDGKVYGYYKGDTFNKGRHEMQINEGDYIYFSLDGQRSRIKFVNGEFSVKEGYELFPAAYVTWFGANAYARFYNYRLPTVLEWEKAARGTEGYCYPFNEEPSPERANYYKSHDPFDIANGTTPVGFFNGNSHGDFKTINSPSPYGCYDMAGNVAEWMGDILTGSHLRLIYGGSMMEYGYNLRSFTENSGVGEYSSFQVGFRCIREIPENEKEAE